MSLSKLLRRHNNLRWHHAALILTAALLLVNWQLLAGRVFERADGYNFFSPYYSLIADFARAGRLLLWNPWTDGGSPDFAEPQVGAFSPVLFFFALVAGGSSDAFRIYWLVLWLAGGLGMLLLARHFRAPVWAGLCVALGFTFSGFYTGHAEHTSVLYSYSFLPFVIWRLDVSLQRGNLFAAAQAGALWGLSALAGNPTVTISSVGLIVAWVVGRSCFAEEDAPARGWKQALSVLTMVGIVGTIVLAPTYFSFLFEGHGYSDRSEPLPRRFALSSNAFHPGALVTLISPAFMQLRFADPDLWFYTDVSSLNLYLGTTILVLAVIALLRSEQPRWRWFVGATAIFVFACAMSRTLPFRGWLYDLLPATRYFRHSSMFRGYAMFLICVLALLGARDLAGLATDRVLRRKFLLVATFLSAAAAVTFAIVAFAIEAENPYSFLAIAHFVATWCGLLALAYAVDRAPASCSGLVPAALLSLAIIDGVVASHLSEETLYSAGPSPDSIAAHDSSIALGPAQVRRIFDLGRGNLNLIPKIPTLKGYAAFKNRFHEATIRNPVLSSIALGENRFWFAAEAPEIELSRESFEKFERRVQDISAPVIVRHSRHSMLHVSDSMLNGPAMTESNANALERAFAATRATPQIISYSPDRLVLDTSVPEDGWLMVTERWSRSWHASVNGIDTPIEGADFIYRAVWVRKGSNRVEFSFRPSGVYALVGLSWFTLGGIGFLSFIAARRAAGTVPAFASGYRSPSPARSPPQKLLSNVGVVALSGKRWDSAINYLRLTDVDRMLLSLLPLAWPSAPDCRDALLLCSALRSHVFFFFFFL